MDECMNSPRFKRYSFKGGSGLHFLKESVVNVTDVTVGHVTDVTHVTGIGQLPSSADLDAVAEEERIKQATGGNNGRT